MGKFKKETIKESGKILFDIAKLVIAVAIITPLVKDEAIGVFPFLFAFLLMIPGIYLFDKGAKDE